MPDPLKSFPYIVADGANQPASAAWDREFADSPVEGSGFEDRCRRQAQRCARSERSERTAANGGLAAILAAGTPGVRTDAAAVAAPPVLAPASGRASPDASSDDTSRRGHCFTATDGSNP